MNTARLGAFYILMITRLLGAVGFCFVLVSQTAIASAQEPKSLDPAVVIGLVQSFYDQTKTLQAEFEQTRYTRLYDRYDRAKGKVVFKKPGMMRWDYAQPNGQVFVSNGKKLLIYQPPEEGEKSGQLIERGLDQDQLPSAFSFLIGSGNLEQDFEVRLLEHDNEKFHGGYVLQLIPRKPTPNYEQLVFYVRTLTTDGKRAGIVQRVLIIDAAGNRNRFDFSKIKFNRDVPDKRFSILSASARDPGLPRISSSSNTMVSEPNVGIAPPHCKKPARAFSRDKRNTCSRGVSPSNIDSSISAASTLNVTANCLSNSRRRGDAEASNIVCCEFMRGGTGDFE